MRSCIFCGAGPVTKEDAWPVWLVEHIGRSRLIASMVGGKRAPYRTDRIVQRVGCACRKCNNGWMSDLEGLAKPILLPLVDGKPVQILGIDQAIIAAWMLKTLMVFDSIDRQYWRQAERDLMHQRKFGPALGDSLTAAAHYIGSYKAFAYPRRQTVRRLIR